MQNIIFHFWPKLTHLAARSLTLSAIAELLVRFPCTALMSVVVPYGHCKKVLIVTTKWKAVVVAPSRAGPGRAGPENSGPCRPLVCNDTPMTFGKFIAVLFHCLKLDTRRPQYDKGPARADTSRPGPAQSDAILARTRPGPLKFVNFWPKPGGRAYGPPGPCRTLVPLPAPELLPAHPSRNRGSFLRC